MTDDADTQNAIQFADSLSLPAVLADCWQSLAKSISVRDCGWRLPVLGTAGNEGIRQRLVVLRKVLPLERRLLVHTDARSPKIDAIQQNSRVSWLFYDHVAMSQLQIQGTATIHTKDEVAQALWAAEPEASLRGYLAPFCPGTVCDTHEFNLPESVLGRIPDRSELQTARDNFAVISCEVQAVEWLLLRREGNLRAVFEYLDDGVKAHWLAP